MSLPSHHYFLLFVLLLRLACCQPDKAEVFSAFLVEVLLYFHQAIRMKETVHWLKKSKTFCSKLTLLDHSNHVNEMLAALGKATYLHLAE